MRARYDKRIQGINLMSLGDYDSAKSGDVRRLVQGGDVGSVKIGTDAGGRKDNAAKRMPDGGVVLPF